MWTVEKQLRKLSQYYIEQRLYDSSLHFTISELSIFDVGDHNRKLYGMYYTPIRNPYDLKETLKNDMMISKMLVRGSNVRDVILDDAREIVLYVSTAKEQKRERYQKHFNKKRA